MKNENLHGITNSFRDVHLASFASWKRASEIEPRDRGGPFLVVQQGYDPEDPNLAADEFVLGRSGRWLSLGHFFRLGVPERRAEFIFGTAAEVMDLMSRLPSKVAILRPGPESQGAAVTPETDEMAAAYQASRGRAQGGAAGKV